MNTLSPIRRGLMTIASLLAIGSFATQAIAAGPVFNDLDGDLEFLVGRNATTNQPNWSDPVLAEANQEVDVRVYYHNARPDTVANNVKIKVSLPSGNLYTHVISASLSADNATTVTGTVVNGVEKGKKDLTVVSSTETAMSFVPGSVAWYPNRPADLSDSNKVNLPFGQNGDSITSSGINLGDLNGCFQYSGFVVFRVKLTGITHTPTPTPTPGKAHLSIKKYVRLGGTEDTFVSSNVVNPGNQVEYQVILKNEDGAVTAKNVKVTDLLPTGETYVGPLVMTRGGLKTTIAGTEVVTSGITLENLQPLEQITFTFLAQTATTFSDNQCVINTVKSTAENVDGEVSATAQTCFVVKKTTPTPTPTSTPSNPPVHPPVKELPKTGGDLAVTLFSLAGISTAGGRYLQLKSRVKKASRSANII